MNIKPIEMDSILANLANGPLILKSLLDQIPINIYKEKRIPGKWCIHAHACHIVDVQPMLIARLERFLKEDEPTFVPYIPSGESGEEPLLKMDLNYQFDIFPELRTKLIGMVQNAPEKLWTKRGLHPEYFSYTPSLMIRHIMMHDYLHMYRIEELWVTKDMFLRK